MVEVRRHASAAEFLGRAQDWLLRAEAEHNLVLGLAARLRESAAGYDPPIYLATLEVSGELVGCAFRTPPHKLGLTRMPAAAVDALAEDVAGVYETLPAVLGPEEAAARFAERWAASHGTRAIPGMRQRIYQLDELVEPPVRAAGEPRWADAHDMDRAAQWLVLFTAEAGVGPTDPRRTVEDLIRRQALLVWEDAGEPVSIAAVAALTPNGARVGYVYTPPELRGRGYGTSCTAELSRRLLASGRRFCFLYTDLSNSTSNAIYLGLGYRPVCDVRDYTFEDPPP